MRQLLGALAWWYARQTLPLNGFPHPYPFLNFTSFLYTDSTRTIYCCVQAPTRRDSDVSTRMLVVACLHLTNTKGDALTNPNKPNLPPCLRQAGVDIDISALAFDAAGNQLDACFFKKPEACNGAIGNMGDNTTGFGYVDTRFFQACDILLLFFLLVFSPRNNTLGPIKCVRNL